MTIYIETYDGEYHTIEEVECQTFRQLDLHRVMANESVVITFSAEIVQFKLNAFT